MAIPPHLKHKYADEAAWEKSEDFKAQQYVLAARLKEKEKEAAEKAQKARFEEIADDDAAPRKELKPGDKFQVTAKEDAPSAPPNAPNAPKKKKKKSKGQKNANKPSGFEEFATEAPLTVEQVAAQAELYNPQKSFPQRIETCIQKYRSKRKWNEFRSQIFDSYLALGGIKPGPKMFSGGFDPKRAPEMDAEEIHNMTATDYLPEGEESEFIVSFTDIARAFLSYRLPYELCISKPEDLEHACTIIKNFLNYVLYHNVAPEHADDVLAARDICDQAERELILCKEMSTRFPGRFNMAASVIHDGYYAGMHTGTVPAWQDGDRIDAGMELTMSHDIYAEGIRKCGTKEQQDTIKTAKVVKRTYMLLEVTDVVMPETLPPVEGEALTGLKTLGVLKLKPWVMEDGDSVNPEIPADEMGEFDLWLEKENLQYCFRGMKIETRVHRLDNGMRFIDSITGVMCSFYLLLDEEEDDTIEFGP